MSNQKESKDASGDIGYARFFRCQCGAEYLAEVNVYSVRCECGKEIVYEKPKGAPNLTVI